MLVSDFDYRLPERLIAQVPLADRSASRMLRLERKTGRLEDRRFQDLPDLLRADDLVVFNNTRVFPARLYGRRSGSRAQPLSPRNPASKGFLQGRVEVLLTNCAISNLMREGKTFQIPSMMQVGRAQGMVSLNDALAELVRKGLVAPEEAILRAVDKAGLEMLLKRR